MLRFPRFQLVLITAALALSACSQSETNGAAGAAGAAAQKVEVGVITLHPQAVTITAEPPGRTKASATAEIRPQVAGIIKEVAFTEGGKVKAGDLLYRIDPASYEASYQSALAALQKAQAAVPSAQAKVDRYAKLAGINSISEQDLDEANAALLQAKADVASAQAAVDTAKINLDYTQVTAPISGLISTSSVTQGALVTANQTDALATIRQIDPMNVDLSDSSTNLLRVRNMFTSGRLKSTGEAPKVRLRLEDGSDYKEIGTLKSQEAAVSETTGTFSMRVTIANPDGILLPGMYVRAIVDLGIDEKAFLLPQRAVSRNAKGQATAMFVGAGGKVETRILTTQQSYGTNWLVDDGIADGDQLIVDGLQKIRDGQEVTPTEVTLNAAGVVEQPSSAAPAASDASKN